MSTGDHRRRDQRDRPPSTAAAPFVGDVWVVARRGLLHMRRQPEALADATFQPVMFVLLFAYVFGGAINVPGGGGYREFLMGGIFAQTIVFGAFGVAIALAYDRKNGAIDRFRSLPMARGAVLGGHAVANLLKARAADRAHVDLRARRRLAHPQRRPARGGRLRPDDRLRVRDHLDRRAARQHVPSPEARAGRRVRRDLPDHVHREHVRARRARLPGRPADLRRVEPGHVAGGARCAASSATPAARRRRARPGRSSTRCLHAALVVAIIAVCAPLAIRATRRRSRAERPRHAA